MGNDEIRKVSASEMEAAELAAILAAGFEDASELLAAYSTLLKHQEMSQAERLADELGKGGEVALAKRDAQEYRLNTGREPNEIDMFWLVLSNGRKILIDGEIQAIGNFLSVQTPLEINGRSLINVNNIASIDFSF